jgi:hypothetical protein
VRLGESHIEIERTLRRGFGARKGLCRRQIVVEAEHRVRVREAAECLRIIRREHRRPLEQCCGSCQAVPGSLVPEISSLQIQVIRLRRHDEGAANRGIAARSPAVEDLEHLGEDLLLDGWHVIKWLVPRVRPDLVAIAGVHDADGNADAILHLKDASFQ